ncbi:Rho-related GTP-binding protein RhoN [Bagarius yarrelli]|uniref:Rho-related GTP-binding protein RhoN n=1 Tax=Bagarius yarrelli TaxID=175774 RepID=A0A556TUU5_BAGYA|nr:Rho-related GTP-binding protein RhoN [Bagarius yarrelli]
MLKRLKLGDTVRHKRLFSCQRGFSSVSVSVSVSQKEPLYSGLYTFCPVFSAPLRILAVNSAWCSVLRLCARGSDGNDLPGALMEGQGQGQGQGQISRCKIVVVGDTQCGKTALLHVFAKDSYPERYVPTVFENYTASFEIDKHRIELNMWDTSGSSYYDNWQAEAQEYCPIAKLVLVGCKLDMRTDVSTLRELSKQRLIPVTHEQGSLRARELGAVAYVECSSRVCVNSVRDVFHITTLASVRRPGLKRSSSRRTLKRISHQPLLPISSRTVPLEPAPTLRKDRAKSCNIM